MTDNNPFSDTQKIIRCNVINKYNELSVRMIEFDSFRLWEYLMTHKHGASIKDVTLCLWVSEDEYHEHQNIYERSGEAEPVNRIIIDLFDEEYGFSHAITRFVRVAETEQVIQILTSHMPENLCGSDDCRVQTYAGYLITQTQRQHSKRPMLMGLDN